MATIRVSVEEMQAAAVECKNLSEQIEECRQKCISLNTQLQSAWDGVAAQAFDEFVNGTATKVLSECSQMCCETGQAITHTCNQFSDADSELSKTFRN